MSDAYHRNLDEPDETVRLPGVTENLVELGDITVGRATHEPGWRWSKDLRPLVGGELCMARHIGVVISGKLGVRIGEEEPFEVVQGDVYNIPPGHDGYTVGDEPVVVIEWSGVRAFAGFSPGKRKRILATLLFTNLADSLRLAEELGDSRWRETLASFYETARSEIEQFGGKPIKTTEDGFLATFDGPALALGFASALRRRAQAGGWPIRTGIHVSEVEVAGDDIRGVGVLEAARICDSAAGDEILLSRIAHTLVAPARFTFEDRGSTSLSGKAAEMHVYAYLE